jgi:uncharacterized protein
MTLSKSYTRLQAGILRARLDEPRRFVQVISGPRQVGKTTLVQQVLQSTSLPWVFASADEPSLRGHGWIEQQWNAARLRARESATGAVLTLDEIQKIPDWSETIKRLWDEDSTNRTPVKVIVLGSTPLLVRRGLTESLAGRFEVITLPHWSLAEMRAAFGWDLDTYLLFGGYPGAAPLIGEPDRWSRYIRDALIETTIARDILLLTRVDKPALLRRLFELACAYSGQILSYQKMLGQLQDVGNTTTLAHYLELLGEAGMVMGLTKYAGEAVRQRSSSPKFCVLNTALVTAQLGRSVPDARRDSEWWGRLVESAVGAHLANAALAGGCEVFYWRDRNREVDYVARAGEFVTAIEVKSGRTRGELPGISAFAAAFEPHRTLLVGSGGIPLEEFLGQPAGHWTEP